MSPSPLDSPSRFTPDGWRGVGEEKERQMVSMAERIAVAFHGNPEGWQAWAAQEGLSLAQGVQPMHGPVHVQIGPEKAQVRLLDGLWDVLLTVLADGYPRGCLITLYDPFGSPLLVSRPAMVP